MDISIDATAADCRYVDPPADLCPTGRIGEDDTWHDLWSWFEDQTASAHDAMLVYIARRYGQTIEGAYAATDGWMKSKLGMCGFN